MGNALASLTILEFSESDHAEAQRLCKKLGYGNSYAYATSSYLPGLYCLPLHPRQNTTVIIKTAEFGLMAIQTFEE